VQSLKCLLTATRFSEFLLLGRVNSWHGFHEPIVIHASGFYTLTLSAEEGQNAANKLTAECPPPRTVVLGTAVRILLRILVVARFTFRYVDPTCRTLESSTGGHCESVISRRCSHEKSVASRKAIQLTEYRSEFERACCLLGLILKGKCDSI
jgi:hypothetical protein